jgi:hypothetical protein
MRVGGEIRFGLGLCLSSARSVCVSYSHEGRQAGRETKVDFEEQRNFDTQESGIHACLHPSCVLLQHTSY